MDEELPVEERSARAVRKSGEPTPMERSAHEGTQLPFPRAERPTQRLTERERESGGRTAGGADRPPVRFGEDEHGDQRRTGRHSWGRRSPSSWGVAATQCSKGAIAYLAVRPGVSDQELWC